MTVQVEKVRRASVKESDRCDSCGSKAYVCALIASVNLPLHFCAHHFHIHEARLSKIAIICDERARLIPKNLQSISSHPG